MQCQLYSVSVKKYNFYQTQKQRKKPNETKQTKNNRKNIPQQNDNNKKKTTKNFKPNQPNKDKPINIKIPPQKSPLSELQTLYKSRFHWFFSAIANVSLCDNYQMSSHQDRL